MKIIETILLSIIIVFFVVTDTFPAELDINMKPELCEMARKIKDAVLYKDIAYLIDYVAPEGMYFVDASYSHAQVLELINDEHSWLYKHLFIGENSIKHFFIQADDLDIKIYYRGANAIMISYQSSHVEEHEWIENCLILINGKWYFDGIFVCD